VHYLIWKRHLSLYMLIVFLLPFLSFVSLIRANSHLSRRYAWLILLKREEPCSSRKIYPDSRASRTWNIIVKNISTWRVRISNEKRRNKIKKSLGYTLWFTPHVNLDISFVKITSTILRNNEIYVIVNITIKKWRLIAHFILNILILNISCDREILVLCV